MIDIVNTRISGKRTSGTLKAPDVILSQIKDIWSNETCEPMDKFQVYEWDNWQYSGNRTAFLGGDHSLTSLTYPKVSNYATNRLIVFDAHLDMAKNDKLFHGNWLRKLIEDGRINPNHISIYGVRSWQEEEWKYQDNIECTTIKPFINRTYKEDEFIYLSIDIDVVDPAFAPGTGYMEPGGWSSRDLIESIKTLRNHNLIAMDIVEVDPTRDFNDMTSKLAAKVIKEFL